MTERYANYSVEDFAGDEEFIRWAKYEQPEAHSIWNEVIREYPYQTDHIIQARRIVRELDHTFEAERYQDDANAIWQGIESGMDDNSGRFGWVTRLNSIYYLAAASILLFVGIGFWQTRNAGTQQLEVYTSLLEENALELREVVNTTNDTMDIVLPDGSRVDLAPSSRMSYEPAFAGAERKVILSGGAFFDVVKNPARPFLVYSNEIVTRVVGTSFFVKAFENDPSVTVSVKTGKVQVAGNARRSGAKAGKVMLVPNQEVVFSRKNMVLKRSLVKEPQPLLPVEELKQFTFSNAPVSEIFEALHKAYGIDIIFDGEVMASCKLTTSLSNETLFERLDVLCEAIDATYRIDDGRIVVDGKGCN